MLPGHPCLNFFAESDTPHPCRIPSVICRVPKNSNESDTYTRVGHRHPHPCPCNTGSGYTRFLELSPDQSFVVLLSSCMHSVTFTFLFAHFFKKKKLPVCTTYAASSFYWCDEIWLIVVLTTLLLDLPNDALTFE